MDPDPIDSRYYFLMGDPPRPVGELNYNDPTGMNSTRITEHASHANSHETPSNALCATTLDGTERPHKCRYQGCPGPVTAFKRMYDRNRHEIEKHIGAKYFCSIASCGRHTKGFARTENLEKHERIKHNLLIAPSSASTVDSRKPKKVRGGRLSLRPSAPARQLQPQPASSAAAAMALDSSSGTSLPMSPTLTYTTETSSLSAGSSRDFSLMHGLKAQRQLVSQQLSNIDAAIEAEAWKERNSFDLTAWLLDGSNQGLDMTGNNVGNIVQDWSWEMMDPTFAFEV